MNKNLKIALTMLLTFSLVGCTSVPKTELQNLPSMVEIVMLNLADAQLKVRVSHRNRTTRENNQLSCKLAIKDHPSVEFNAIPIPDLTTYAVETVEISLADQTLPAADNNHGDLPYVLDCFLFSENFRNEHLVKKATLYPVPGTKAEFR